MNIHGALNLETFDAPFVEPTIVGSTNTAHLLAKIEARNPDKRVIHVIEDNAAYNKGSDVREFLHGRIAASTCSNYRHIVFS